MKSLTVTPFIRDSFENYQKSACGITLDIGRQRINQKELLSLIDFVKEKKMIESFNEMRKGKIVNASEHRSALHTSLRDPSPDAPHAAEVHQTLEAFCKFAEDVRNWKWRGCSGDRITDVINIGIGGSDMGPKCVYNALRPNKPEIKLHFLASADGVIFDRITSVLDPFSTLIVISSKSFKTQETRANTQEILDWLKKAGIPEKDFKHHVVVVSAKPDAAEQFGLPKENFFPIWDWVGGRFSVWVPSACRSQSLSAQILSNDSLRAPMRWTNMLRPLRCRTICPRSWPCSLTGTRKNSTFLLTASSLMTNVFVSWLTGCSSWKWKA